LAIAADSPVLSLGLACEKVDPLSMMASVRVRRGVNDDSSDDELNNMVPPFFGVIGAWRSMVVCRDATIQKLEKPMC
jgi:hypothetical protein